MLTPGTRLGAYEIVAPLGAGGMGDVYRATDTRLGREVALKLLPEGFADDPDRHARFEREAKVLASLNHPHIAHLYALEHLDPSASGHGPQATGHDVERAPGALHVLVMELVEGEDLAARIDRGPIPADEVIPIARQIAEALEAAHGQGIVHRDLKPANIKLRPDGTVKVLDFGLAKAVGAAAASDPSFSPTMTHAATQAGLILGTAAYMSPEQARGKAVDKRADIWAFGVVLFEMLTGRRLFEGETVSDVMAGVLRADIDLDTLPGATPPALRRVLMRCLERDPRRRLRDAGDAALELVDSPEDETVRDDTPLPAATATRRSAPLWAWAVTALAVVATVVAVWALTHRGHTAAAAAPALFFEPKTFDQQVIFNARFLPDGRGVVYSAAATGNRPELLVLPSGEKSPRRLAPAGTHLLSVSHTGELAVLTDATFTNHRVFVGTLARMTLDGSPRGLIEAVREADWGPDGSLAIVRRVAGRDRLEYPAGTVLHETPGYVSEPRVSPDGTVVAFLDHQWWLDDRGWLRIVDRSGRVTTLSEEFWAIEGLAWSGDGKTLYFSGASTAVNLQPRAATLGAEGTRPVFNAPGEVTVLDVNRDGDWLAILEQTRYGVAVRPRGVDADVDLTWLDSSWGATLAPDGQSVLFSDGRGGPNYAAVTRRLDGSPITTLGEGNAKGFSPDGRWVAALIASPPGVGIYPTGAGTARVLPRGPIEQYQDVQWFPDGTHVLVSGNEPSRRVRAYRQAIAGGDPEPVTPEGVDGLLSPDGTRVIAPDGEGNWRLHPIGGGEPAPARGLQPTDSLVAWTPDGTAVFVYREGIVPAVIERIDLASGNRTQALTLDPPEKAGLLRIWLSARVLDPSHDYAYSYQRRLSRLFLVEGVPR